MKTIENTSLEQLQNTIVDLQSTLEHRDHKITYLEEQLAWFKRQIFGKRSERVVANLNSQQLTLEGFDNVQAADEEQKKTVAPHTRSKPNRKGQDAIALSPDLPVQTTIIDIPEDQKIDAETGIPLVQIGVDITHKLAHEPGSYYVKEIIRPKYAHPKKEEAGIVQAALPESLLSKCRADDSLLAEIATRKFGDHLPLYRIAEIMGREGVQISRKLLSQWMVRCGMALKPLYDVMLEQILKNGNIFIDEIPVKLQEVGKCKTAYVWVVVGGNESNPTYRIYVFREDRCHDNVLDILKNYTKYAFARLDNNVAERAVRPLAIGRKNWLFFGSPESGEAGAILLSFIQTCRGLGINPREYLEDIFRRLMSHNSQRLHELLPDQWLANRKNAVLSS